MQRARVGWAVLAAVLQTSPVQAAAPEPPPSSEADRGQADALFHEGVQAVHAGDLERARRLFAASYELLPRGSTLGNLGHVEVDLGRVVDGLHHLKQALTLLEAGDEKRLALQTTFDAAYAKTGHLAIRAKPGAALAVDGTPVPGAAPFAEPIDVMPGKHVLEARLEDTRTRQEVEAPAGSVVEVDLAVPGPSAPLPAPPAPSAGPPPGEPLVRGETPPPSAAHPSWWTTPRVVGVGLGAGAVVALGVGISLHVAAVNAVNDASSLRNNQITPGECTLSPGQSACANLRGKVQAVDADNTAAKVSWVVSGAAAAGALVAFVLGASSRAPSSAAGVVVRPTLSPAGAGLEGRF